MTNYTTWKHRPRRSVWRTVDEATRAVMHVLFVAVVVVLVTFGLVLGLFNFGAYVADKARTDAAYACQIGADCK